MGLRSAAKPALSTSVLKLTPILLVASGICFEGVTAVYAALNFIWIATSWRPTQLLSTNMMSLASC
jgi:hypothetical protein